MKHSRGSFGEKWRLERMLRESTFGGVHRGRFTHSGSRQSHLGLDTPREEVDTDVSGDLVHQGGRPFQ